MAFPERGDYVSHLVEHGYHGDAHAALQSDDTVQEIQRHWHTLGMNGCAYAQFAALHAKQLGWTFRVCRAVGRDLAFEVDATLRQACADPTCEIVSVLLPHIASLDDLMSAIKALKQSAEFAVVE